MGGRAGEREEGGGKWEGLERRILLPLHAAAQNTPSYKTFSPEIERFYRIYTPRRASGGGFKGRQEGSRADRRVQVRDQIKNLGSPRLRSL